MLSVAAILLENLPRNPRQRFGQVRSTCKSSKIEEQIKWRARRCNGRPPGPQEVDPVDTQQSSERPTEGGSVRAIAFAAKSTADPHGSIEGQLQDARKLAEKQGLVLVNEYHDESASAYH